MKKFLKRITIFFVPIFLLLFIAEFSVRKIPNSYKLKGEYLKKNAKSIQNIALGSSHTFYGIKPEYFSSKTFNAGNISQSPDVDFAILKSYEDKFTNLRAVIIRLSYDTLFEQLKNSPEDWRLKDYKLYTDVEFDYSFKHNFELLSIGTSRCFKVLKNYYFNDDPLLNSDSLGWGNDLGNKTKTNINKAGVIVAKRHTIKAWDLLEDNVKIFQQLIEWCQQRNIKVLLVTPPAYRSYTENLNKNQFNKMTQVGNDLNSKYNNCTYYNLLNHEGFMAEDFYDADHLNAKGAKKFSLIINSLIEI
ncbi:hypothetical protein [Winogradskyella sp. R77965]|uniref:hypothetical protein n=1 Tax=Winogradskyella sp. R77965 TaxID=3093872 RepID=UPI0037DC4BAF